MECQVNARNRQKMAARRNNIKSETSTAKKVIKRVETNYDK